MFRHHRHLSTAALIVLALGSFAACGGDDDDEGVSPVDTPSETTADPADVAPPEDGDDEGAGGDEQDEGSESDSGLDLPAACDLLTDEEVEAAIGTATSEGEDDVAIDGLSYSQCFWEDAEGNQMIGVGVVETTDRFDMHVGNMPSYEELPGLGDEAIAFPGVSSETRGATGGRTISISVDDRTVTVSLRLDGETPVDAVTPLAEAVLARF